VCDRVHASSVRERHRDRARATPWSALPRADRSSSATRSARSSPAALERLDLLRHGPDDREPGSAQRLELVVCDIEAARDDLISRCVEVSELFHRGDSGLMPGPDPERRSYLTYASSSDPDGNGWLLQEVTNRLPGRLWED
jgi:hypothetical protein